MSYTEADVIQNIYEDIVKDFHINSIIRILINWFEQEKQNFKVNNWDYKKLDIRIRRLKLKEGN